MLTVSIPSTNSIAVHDRKFTPRNLTGLALWLDASDASTITLDGSNNVSKWADKSGNGRDLTQSDPAKMPGFILGDGLQYTAAGHVLANAAGVNFPSGGSIFVAFRPISVAGYSSAGSDTLAQIGGYLLGTTSDGAFWGRYYVTKVFVSTNFLTGMNVIAITDRVYSLVANAVDTRARILGATTQNQTIPPLILSSSSTPTVGAFPRGNMVVREVIAVNAPVSDGVRESVERYLRAKWTT